MVPSALRFCAAAFVLSLGLTACGGGSKSAVPAADPARPADATQAATFTASSTGNSSTNTNFAIPTAGTGYDGKLEVSFKQIARGTNLRVGFIVPATAGPCPSVPLVQIQNTAATPVVMDITKLEIESPCSVAGKLFGASFFQLQPQPSVVTAQKLDNATGQGNEVEFEPPPPMEVTLPPNSITAIAVLTETDPNEVALPVLNGANTQLTSNTVQTPSQLTFQYGTSSGGNVYSSVCANGAPSGQPQVGTSSFFCKVTPHNANQLTFGSTTQNAVNFTISSTIPDISVLGLDGPITTFACGTSTVQTPCTTTAFTISNTVSASTFQNVIVGNAQDMHECFEAAASGATDCNVTAIVLTPGSRSRVLKSEDGNHNQQPTFEVQISDDPTYKPGTTASPVPWSGLLHITLGTTAPATTVPCAFATTAPGLFPPAYASDVVTPTSATTGTVPGPSAAFDVVGTVPGGNCVVTITEDTNFITVFDPVSNTKSPRSTSVTIPVPAATPTPSPTSTPTNIS